MTRAVNIQGIGTLSVTAVDLRAEIGATVGGAIDQLQRLVPGPAFKGLAQALWVWAGRFMADFRRRVQGRFKVNNTRVGNAFRKYVAGDTLDTLRLGIYTEWLVARIFEFGGTIQPRNRSWLVIPVAPDAYDADGRVKPAWREKIKTVFGQDIGIGGFGKRRFHDLVPIHVRGGWLLIKPAGDFEEHAEADRFTMGNREHRGRAMFLLLKSTARKPILGFLAAAGQAILKFREIAVEIIQKRLDESVVKGRAA